LVEKDWHVVRVLAVLAAVDHGDAAPAFSGGTSLSKGWGLIKRFSEDIDFKVAMPAAASHAKARQQRSAYRERILDALTAGGFTQAGAPLVGDQSRFFSVDLRTRVCSASGRASVRTSGSRCRFMHRLCRPLHAQSSR